MRKIFRARHADPQLQADFNDCNIERARWRKEAEREHESENARLQGRARVGAQAITETLKTEQLRAPLKNILGNAAMSEQYADAYRIDAKDIELAPLALEEKATMSEFQKYCRKQIAELRPYVVGEELRGISISHADLVAGSPKAGDMIARNPKNHADLWLVAAQYFADNFEPV